MRYCEKCGAQCGDGDLFCGQCGAPLNGAAPDQAANPGAEAPQTAANGPQTPNGPQTAANELQTAANGPQTPNGPQAAANELQAAAPRPEHAQPRAQAARPAAGEESGAGTAGLVLGIVSLVLCWIPGLSTLAAVLGVIFSAVGKSRGSRYATAGLVTGILGLVLSLFLLLGLVLSCTEAFYQEVLPEIDGFFEFDGMRL